MSANRFGPRIIQGLFSAVLLTDCAEKPCFFFPSMLFSLFSSTFRLALIKTSADHAISCTLSNPPESCGRILHRSAAHIKEIFDSTIVCVCVGERLCLCVQMCVSVCVCVVVDESQPGRERECTLLDSRFSSWRNNFFFFPFIATYATSASACDDESRNLKSWNYLPKLKSRAEIFFC